MKRHYFLYVFLVGFMIISGFLAWGIFDPLFAGKVSRQEPVKKGLFWKQPDQGTVIAGKVLAQISNGDYMHPKISPNNRFLVYAEVAVEKDTNNLYTQIELYNIKNQEKSTLMDGEGSKKYGCDNAFVTDIRWINDQQLDVKMSDDYMKESILRFDLHTGQITKTEQNINDGLDFQMPSDRQKIYDTTLASFPDFDKDVLHSIFQNGTFFPAGRKLVLQKRYVGQDYHVWLLDPGSKSPAKLLALPNEKYRLEGGLAFKGVILFLVADNSQARFYLYNHRKVEQIAAIAVKQRDITLDLKHQTKDRIIFLAKIYDSYEKGNNPLYVFNGRNLLPVDDYPELYDVDISSDGKKAVFCFWENGERHLAVKDLNGK